MKNDYIIDGDTVIIYLRRRTGIVEARTKNGYRVSIQSGGKTVFDRRVKDLSEAKRLAVEKRKEIFPFTREEAMPC